MGKPMFIWKKAVMSVYVPDSYQYVHVLAGARLVVSWVVEMGRLQLECVQVEEHRRMSHNVAAARQATVDLDDQQLPLRQDGLNLPAFTHATCLYICQGSDSLAYKNSRTFPGLSRTPKNVFPGHCIAQQCPNIMTNGSY